MFSSSIRAPLLAFAAYGITVSATPAISADPSLTVKTWTQNGNIDGVKNLMVIATIVNTGGETLKLLNDPRGVLDAFPENTFTITDPSGSHPPFTGAKISYNTAYAAGLACPEAFTVLAPGNSISITHDLPAAYNFTQSGTGDYSIEPSNLFTYVDADGAPRELYAAVEGIAKVKLSGNLPLSQHIHNRRTGYTGCSAIQQAVINATAYAAQKIAAEAYAYIKNVSGPTPRYTTWFGAYDPARKARVQSVLKRISKNTQFPKLTYHCDCDKDAAGAYVHPISAGEVWVCPDFWRRSIKYQDVVFIHEVSHFYTNGGTEDFVYGETAANSLAVNEPAKAINNADNYMTFAWNDDGLK